MTSQCHGQRNSLTVQLNARPVRRIELNRKVCTGGQSKDGVTLYFVLWTTHSTCSKRYDEFQFLSTNSGQRVFEVCCGSFYVNLLFV